MAAMFSHHESDPPFQPLGGVLYKTETDDGYEFYKKTGTQFLFHSENGPARYREDLFGHYEEYWVDGKRHRTDGPAVLHSVGGLEQPTFDQAGNINFYLGNSGLIHMEWWLDDERLVLQKWLHEVGLPDRDLALLLLKWC